MWKTFRAELKHIFTNKWRIAGLILLIFLPFVYGFLYMNAYWAPFSHVDKLKIAIVSKDEASPSSENPSLADLLIKKMVKTGAITAGSNQVYDVVEDKNISDDPEGAVDSGKYAAVIIIPKGYSDAMTQFAIDLTPSKINPTAQLKIKESLERAIKSMEILNPKAGDKKGYDRVTFYFSYKHSYLAGEMVNYISTNTKLVLNSLFPQILSSNTGADASLIHILEDMARNKTSNIFSIHKYGNERFNSYGMGLSPYFISIALWAGALATLFVVKNERHIKTENVYKHYFGKLLIWIAIGWMQALILTTAITIQGVNLGWGNQWKIFAYALFMATVFPTIVMGVAYTMRFGDMGEFMVVILLVIQLISSSGTFPVDMQNIIFKIIHPVAPFTYTISSLREIMWDTNIAKLFMNMGVLLLFPLAITPLTLFLNYRYDVKSKITIDNKTLYKSYEIHLGDF